MWCLDHLLYSHQYFSHLINIFFILWQLLNFSLSKIKSHLMTSFFLNRYNFLRLFRCFLFHLKISFRDTQLNSSFHIYIVCISFITCLENGLTGLKILVFNMLSNSFIFLLGEFKAFKEFQFIKKWDNQLNIFFLFL